MSLFGRLIGKHPPLVPTGGRAFLSMDAYDGSAWSVRVQMPGDEPTSACKRLGPSFTSQVVASDYLAWVTGEAATFSYPSGRA